MFCSGTGAPPSVWLGAESHLVMGWKGVEDTSNKLWEGFWVCGRLSVVNMGDSVEVMQAVQLNPAVRPCQFCWQFPLAKCLLVNVAMQNLFLYFLGFFAIFLHTSIIKVDMPFSQDRSEAILCIVCILFWPQCRSEAQLCILCILHLCIMFSK